MLGWMIGLLFKGEPVTELIWLIVLIALVMILRGMFEHWRAMTAHKTAALVQKSYVGIVRSHKNWTCLCW